MMFDVAIIPAKGAEGDSARWTIAFTATSVDLYKLGRIIEKARKRGMVCDEVVAPATGDITVTMNLNQLMGG